MESYHVNSSASRADESARPTVAFNPYLPAIGRVLEVLRGYGPAGTTIELTNRDIATSAACSAGSVPGILRTLESDGYVDRVTSRRGSLIVVRKSDQIIDRSFSASPCDQSHDRFLEVGGEANPIEMPDRSEESDQLIDRSSERSASDQESDPPYNPRMVLTTATAVAESVAVNSDGGMQGGGKRSAGGSSPNDQPHPIALLLAELLPPPGRGVLEKVLLARPWTPQQIRDRYEYDGERIEGSGGSKTWGIFWTALMAGELAPPRRDPDRPIDVAAYADDPGFKPPDKTQQAYADAHWRAVDLLGKGAPFREMAIVVEALVAGDNDEQALAALVEHRSAVRS